MVEFIEMDNGVGQILILRPYGCRKKIVMKAEKFVTSQKITITNYQQLKKKLPP